MQAAMMKGSIPMEMKKISISEKRQITIPQKFFSILCFDTEAEAEKYCNSYVGITEHSDGSYDEHEMNYDEIEV